MNENIDLTKILKDCPKGTKLYSTTLGEVELEDVKYADGVIYPIIVRLNNGLTESFTADGKMLHNFDGECTLFPSKGQRSWSKFTVPWLKKEGYAVAWLEEQGEQAQSQTNEHMWLHLVSDVLTWKDGIGQYLDDPEVQEIAKRLCNKYAQKLYNPSVISNSSNTAKNEQKFDPKTLKEFDRVLVKLSNDDVWDADFFSYYNPLEKCMKYVCVANFAVFCIPYNDETKHLVGTTEEAPEYYRYWED